MSIYLAVFGKPRYLGLVNIGDKKFEDQELSAGRWVVIETLRGLEMALLGGTLSLEQESKYRTTCLDDSSDEHTKGPEPMLQEVTLVGQASEAQMQEHGERRKDEEAVLVRSRQILRAHDFQMKLVDVEYIMDRKKLFFYFTSEQRIDFRAYVRDLAKEFRTRIEMRQIGVRDEAKTVRGVSPCGRPCCCSSWLHRFTPINIRMVKEQNLALNPTKISGICGRLMCCMFYEHATYNEFWKKLPAPGSKIKTPQGNYVLEGLDLRAETVRVSFPEGGEVPIPVAEFERFKDTILRGEPWQKEDKKDIEPDRRPVPQRAAPSRNQIDTPRDDAKSNKKIKPEKISIEEHIAERINTEKASPAHQPLRGQAPQRQYRADGDAGKLPRGRKDVPSNSPRQEEPPRTPTPHVPKERRRPPEQRPRNEQADSSRRDAQGTAQARDPHNTHTGGAPNRRPRHRSPNHANERQGSANTGTTEKGDS